MSTEPNQIKWVGIRLAAGETSIPVTLVATYYTVVEQFVADGAVAKYDTVYISASGKFAKASASVESTMPVVGIANEAAVDGATFEVLLMGTITNDAWTWTPKAVLFASTTLGALTETPPSASGNIVQRVARAISATKILVNPSLEYIEV